MASIQKRQNGRWAVRWRDLEGEQRWRTFKAKADANAFAKSVEAIQVVDPLRLRTRSKQFSAFASEWTDRQVWRATTVDQVECYMRRYLLPEFGSRDLASIRPGEVQAFVRRLSDTLAPASVRLIAAHLRSMCNEAVRDGLLTESPVRYVKLPRLDRSPSAPVTAEQVTVLRTALPVRYRAIVTVAASTGLRQGECLGLTLDRVDFERSTIRVDRQLARNPVPHLLVPPKTSASVRTVPIPPALLVEINTHVERFGLGVSGLLFTDDRNDPMKRRTFSKLWQPGARAAVLPPRTGMHCLRHFYASLLIRNGCSVKVVQARLGHATAAETLDTYAHLWPDDEDRTREAVGRMFAEWVVPPA